jgi:hypothetical protein
MPLSRRQIIRTCKLKGWMLHPTALEGIEGYVSESHDASEDLQAILNVVATKMKNGRTLTTEIWQQVVDEINGDNVEESIGNLKPENASSYCFADLKVVSAFQSPKLVYDTMRKQFHVEQKSWSLFGSAEDKVRY